MISYKEDIPLSTLKLNARILRQLNLIEYSPFESVGLTETGKNVLGIVSNTLKSDEKC